jgi:hypothetical protein
MTHEEMAGLCIRKQQLRAEVDVINFRLKQCDLELPFAVEVDGNAVMVKKPQYRGGVPQVTVVPLLGIGK